MRRTLVLSYILSMLFIVAAHNAVAENRVFIDQVGIHNKIKVTQKGNNNLVRTTQSGEENNTSTGKISRFIPVIGDKRPGVHFDHQTQTGNGNVAEITQTGIKNFAVQYQSGNNNEAYVTQFSTGIANSGNQAIQFQSGNRNYSDITQNGVRLYAETVQEDMNDGRIIIQQDGDNLSVIVHQHQNGAQYP